MDALMGGSRRFGELQEVVDGIAPNILSRRLKHLEHERVIVARPYSQRPPRFEYVLTALGQDLAGALRLLSVWGSEADTASEPLRHAACGTPAEARWWCPTCDRQLRDDESEDIYYL